MVTSGERRVNLIISQPIKQYAAQISLPSITLSDKTVSPCFRAWTHNQYGHGCVARQTSNVWFYRTPNSVDGPICGFSPRVAMVMHQGNIMKEDTEVTLSREYENALTMDQVKSNGDS
jgi:hypothetical protein